MDFFILKERFNDDDDGGRVINYNAAMEQGSVPIDEVIPNRRRREILTLCFCLISLGIDAIPRRSSKSSSKASK